MLLQLTKPLVIFDLETTGLDIARDRIIQISYIKVSPDGAEHRQAYFVNPEQTIPQVVVDLTHITNEMVSTAPTFKQLAPTLLSEFANCDFAGYNSNHFDIPLLAEEFLRAGIDFDFSACQCIDVMHIFQRMERRDLAAAYLFYCGRRMDEDFTAHRADEDTEATWRVLQGQVAMYSATRQTEEKRIIGSDTASLAALSQHSDAVDFAGRMVWRPVTDRNGQPVRDDNGEIVRREAFNFGKYKDQFVADVLRKDPSYYTWMMTADFPRHTKQMLTRIRMREMAKK